MDFELKSRWTGSEFSAGCEMISRFVYLLCLVSLVWLTAGCGSNDPRQIHIQGTAAIKGHPIASGKIFFSPDSRSGNDGPMGIAKIKNGEFDTSEPAGRGVLGGAYKVRIESYVVMKQDVSEGEFKKQVKKNPIPNGFEVDWVIPKDKTEIVKHFDVSPSSN